MNFLYYIKIYFVSLVVFLGIDLVWLTKIAPEFYKNNIGHLLADKPNLFSAAVFYIINILGIIIFAVVPSLNKNSAQSALLLGALYGLVTYATYDLTNYATLRNWPLKVVFVDIAWGMTLSALVSLITYLISSKYL